MSRRLNIPILLSALAFLALLVFAGVGIWRVMSAETALAMEGENDIEYTPPSDIPSSLPGPSLAGVRVAVLELPMNERMMEAGAYARELASWRQWLRSMGASVQAAPLGAQVLVVPRAPCLGVAERRLIAAHLAGGGGLITTGMLGDRDGQCTQLTDTLLVSLLGGPAGSIAPFKPAAGSDYYAVVLGETALGAFVPPGARITLEPANQLVFRGAERSVYFADFYRRPATRRGERYFDGAIAQALVGPGRVVAFGFDLDDVAGSWSRQVAANVVGAAALWAAGRPVPHLAPWPRGYRAAAVVAQDVEADYPNVDAALDVLEREGVPGTFFVVGQLAERNPYITRRVAAYGEVGSHTYDHRALDAFTEVEQRSRLGTAIERTGKLSGQPVLGLRPPEERFTLGTLRAWVELGGDYVFAANNSRSAAPEMVPIGGDTLVLLARVVDDDFELLSRSKLRDRGEMVRRLQGQLADVLAYRGLFMFSYHSHMFAQESLLPVVEALARTLRTTPGVWVTEARAVSRWWRARAAVRTQVSPDGRSVRVWNTGGAPFRGGVLLVDLPDGRRQRTELPELAPGREVTVPVAPAA